MFSFRCALSDAVRRYNGPTIHVNCKVLVCPLRLPGWKLAVHLGLSIKTEVLVVFDKETQHFEARCYDFDRKHPIQACGPDVPSLQKALDAEFHAALKKAFPKEPLMQPHLLVKLSLVPNLPEKSSSPAAEKMPMLPRCCSARAFVRSDE